MPDFTHFNDQGRAKMVDVGEKPVSNRKPQGHRRRTSAGERRSICVNQKRRHKKGDVLTVAQIAGVMGAKRAQDLIPMCHPILLSGINLKLWLDETRHSVEVEASVSCDGRTGVAMEALTVYDMCRAVQKDMCITDIRLQQKTGGIHGDFSREEAE